MSRSWSTSSKSCFTVSMMVTIGLLRINLASEDVCLSWEDCNASRCFCIAVSVISASSLIDATISSAALVHVDALAASRRFANSAAASSGFDEALLVAPWQGLSESEAPSLLQMP